MSQAHSTLCLYHSKFISVSIEFSRLISWAHSTLRLYRSEFISVSIEFFWLICLGHIRPCASAVANLFFLSTVTDFRSSCLSGLQISLSLWRVSHLLSAHDGLLSPFFTIAVFRLSHHGGFWICLPLWWISRPLSIVVDFRSSYYGGFYTLSLLWYISKFSFLGYVLEGTLVLIVGGEKLVSSL